MNIVLSSLESDYNPIESPNGGISFHYNIKDNENTKVTVTYDGYNIFRIVGECIYKDNIFKICEVFRDIKYIKYNSYSFTQVRGLDNQVIFTHGSLEKIFEELEEKE